MNEDEGLEVELDAYYAEYFIIQRALVGLLRDMGIRYGGIDRLPLFWLRTRLEKVIEGGKDKDKLGQAIYLIDELVKYRRDGYEPPHKYGKYT
jgi:hypothetical protein